MVFVLYLLPSEAALFGSDSVVAPPASTYLPTSANAVRLVLLLLAGSLVLQATPTGLTPAHSSAKQQPRKRL